MQAAQVLAGYSLGEADLLRRAMGKKIQAEMDAQRARFVDGCAAHNDITRGQGQRTVRLDRQVRRLRLQQEPRRRLRAGRLSDRLAEGASPAEFYAASMSFDMAQTDKLAIFVEDMRRGGVECLPPDINASHARFHGRGRRGRAMRSARSRASARRRWRRWSKSATRGGPFASLDDFAARIDPRLLNRRQLESLAGGRRVRLRSSPIAPRSLPPPRRSSPMPPSAHDQRDQRAGGPVRRPIRRSRADPPAARRALDAGPAHGRRTRCFRLLFLGPSGRCARHLLAAHKVQDLRRARRDSNVAEGERVGSDHGGTRRGARAGARRPRAGAT